MKTENTNPMSEAGSTKKDFTLLYSANVSNAILGTHQRIFTTKNEARAHSSTHIPQGWPDTKKTGSTAQRRHYSAVVTYFRITIYISHSLPTVPLSRESRPEMRLLHHAAHIARPSQHLPLHPTTLGYPGGGAPSPLPLHPRQRRLSLGLQ